MAVSFTPAAKIIIYQLCRFAVDFSIFFKKAIYWVVFCLIVRESFNDTFRTGEISLVD